MEDNKVLHELKELTEKELEGFVKQGTLNPANVETAKNAVCLINEINKAMKGPMDEMSEGHRMRGYSYCSYGPEWSYGWYDPMMHGENPGRSYGYHGDFRISDDSMMRGRDADTGRFMSRGREARRIHGYEHSGHSIEDRVIDKIEQMMDDAKTEYEYNKLNSFIRIIDSMKGE